MRLRVRTRRALDCSSEVMSSPERPSSSFSPVSFTKSATATVMRPPGTCLSQRRQVAAAATAKPTRMKAVANAVMRRRRRGRSTPRRAARSSASQAFPSCGRVAGSSASAAPSTFATGRGTPSSLGSPTVAAAASGASHIKSVFASDDSLPGAGVLSTGLFPVSISPSTIPAAHTSARSATTAPAACSGAMYAGVPAPLDPCRPQEVRQSEVEQLHPPVLADEDVRRLQIPVQNPTGMGVGEPLCHLLGDPQGLVDGEGTLLDAPRQRLAPEQLHHEVCTRRTRPHVEDGDDGRVVELRNRLGLLLDPRLGYGMPRPLVPGP